MKKTYEEPALRLSSAICFPALSAKQLSDSATVQEANVGVSVGSKVPVLGSVGMRVYDVVTDLGAKNVITKSLSPAFVSPLGIELDVDVYVNNPASCHPTKKALCGDQMLLVTAAWSTFTSASPAQMSLYSNKRTAFHPPQKVEWHCPN